MGKPRTPTAPMARRALAVLLTHAERVVPTDLLIEELWGDQPTKLARKTVQTYIYQIRKALGDDVEVGRGQEILKTHPHGYQLSLVPGQLDLWEFQERMSEAQDSLRRGDAETASELFRRGLDLWRGPALSGMEVGTVLSAQLARLEDLRLRALEQRVETDLQLGRHRSLIGELKELTIQYPFHEEFYAHLMTAAQRSGQRQEALSAYARLRRAMVENFGLEPSTRLKGLQGAVLNDTRDDGAWRVGTGGDGEHVPVSAPHQLPASTACFSGRSREVAAIERIVAEASAGRSVSILLVDGGMGTGKTETVLHVAHRLRDRFPDGQLYATLHDADGTPAESADVLKRLLAAGGHAMDRLPERTEDLSCLFRDWAANRRVLLILDDAADRTQVLPLLPAGTGCVVLVTSRSCLTGLPGSVTRVTLGPMPTDEGVALLGTVAGLDRVAREPVAAREVVERCEGLPIAIRAAGERLAAWPARTVADFAGRLSDGQDRLDELRGPSFDLRQRFDEATRRLPPHILGVLTEICRSGREVTVPQLAGRLDLPPARVEQLVETLVACHMVELVPSGGGYRLRVTELLRLALECGDSGCADATGELAPVVVHRRLRPRHRTAATEQRGAKAGCGTPLD